MNIRPINITDLIRHHFAKNINPWNFNYKMLIEPTFQLMKANPRRALYQYRKILEYPVKGCMKAYTEHLKSIGLEVHRRLWRLRHMARKWIHRVRSRRIDTVNDTDLLFTSFESPTISIIEANKQFRFTAQDILGIFSTSLIYCHNMIPKPSAPSNPYNRNVFSSNTCQRIYTWLRELNVKIPFEMLCYEQSDFSIGRFGCEWYHWLTRNAIRSHVFFQTSKNELMLYMVDILTSKFSLYLEMALKALENMPKDEMLARFGASIVDHLLISNSLLDVKERRPLQSFTIWFAELTRYQRIPLIPNNIKEPARRRLVP